MVLFLSTYVNRVDKKGRVSVPAPFRAVLAGQPYQGIVVFRSSTHPCLEGFSWTTMEEIGARLERLDWFSDAQEDLAMAIFGDSTPLPFDGDGRVVVPEELIGYADIEKQAAFVGLGRKFQIWNPEAFRKRRVEARDNVQSKGLSIPIRPGGDGP